MNINKLARVKTYLDPRDRLLENMYTASLTEFKRVPSLLGSESGLSPNHSHNLAPDLAFNRKAKVEASSPIAKLKLKLKLRCENKLKTQAKAKEQAAKWKPFHSALIDTVKLKVRANHSPLAELAHNNPNIKQDGYKFIINCPQTGACVQMFSKENCQALFLEFSLPKFLTGQNVVGHLDLHAGCLAAIKKAFKLLGFTPSPEERKAITNGLYTLTRVDLAVHVDCGSPEYAQALMMALREFVLSNAGDVSLYGLETGYIGQGSKRRTLKWYRKGIELKKKGRAIPAHVHGCEYLTEVADRLVRFELTLRGKELTRLALTSPLAWDEQVVKKQLGPWICKMKQAEGVLPDANGINRLSAVMQNKLRLWLLGDTLAFTRGVSTDAYREARNKVKAATGLDIQLTPNPQLQAAAYTTIRQLIERGLGFKTYEGKWKLLVESANKNLH